jgi:soluble lytic murein transglycosylase-like protein
MKPSKLPILNNKKYNYLSYVIGIVVTIFFLVALFLPEVEPTLPNSTATTIQPKVSTLESTMQNIVVREGKLPKFVAVQYVQWIFESARKHNVDPVLVLSVMSVESRFDASAVSGANAIGLMQVIHFWHREKTTQANLFLPKNNIEVGVRILAEYKKRSKTETEALLRYNGTLGKTNKYAVKVLSTKDKYNMELKKAIETT